VFVHDPGGPQELILRNQSKVAIDLGADRRIEQRKGQHVVCRYPPDYRGKANSVPVIADGISRADGSPLRVTGESLYVPVSKEGVLFVFFSRYWRVPRGLATENLQLLLEVSVAESSPRSARVIASHYW
jgi:hypothetical protein